MTEAEGFEKLATRVQRLAVLTAAGIPPLPAWRYLAQADADIRVSRVVASASTAHELAAGIALAAGEVPETERSAWGSLAAVWAIATQAGAPLGPTLERTAEVLRSLARSARDVDVALAGPVATSRVVLLLPAVAILMGALLGFDPVGSFASPVGLVCLGGGGALILVAVRWTRRLIRWARDADATAGLGFELFAVALAGGVSIERATRLVGDACRIGGIPPPGPEVEGVLDFGRSAGVPVVALLRAEADDARRRARAAAAQRAARLEARLLLPLGLCVLPAFVLLGVVPVALAVLSSTALVP